MYRDIYGQITTSNFQCLKHCWSHRWDPYQNNFNSPRHSAVDYFSRNQQHDFIIQAVSDGKGLFLDFAAGYPGSLHDARVYRNSSLYQRASNEDILREPVERIGITDIRPYLVGDSAYPISPWLMKPYPEATRDPGEITFNKELSSARVAIEVVGEFYKSG